MNESQVPCSTEEKIRQETLPSVQALSAWWCGLHQHSLSLTSVGCTHASPWDSPQWAWCALCSFPCPLYPLPLSLLAFLHLLAPQVGAFLVVLYFTVISLQRLELCFLMPVALPLPLSTTFLPEDTYIPSYMLGVSSCLALLSLLLITPHSKCQTV